MCHFSLHSTLWIHGVMPHNYAEQCKKIATHTNHSQCIILHKTQAPNSSRAIWVCESDGRTWSCEWRLCCSGETVMWYISCPAVRVCQFWLLWLVVFNARIREIRLKRRTFQNHIYVLYFPKQMRHWLTLVVTQKLIETVALLHTFVHQNLLLSWGA